MPRAYPPEFRARIIALVRAGKPQKQTAHELDIHPITLSKWVKQDRIDRGEVPGVSTTESAELRAARRRIRELETELVVVRQAAKFLGDGRIRAGTRFIDDRLDFPLQPAAGLAHSSNFGRDIEAARQP